MPRANTSWSDLRLGLVAFLVIVAIAATVLLFARVGALHGRTVTMYMVTNEASRVLKGTEVWLGGTKVGVVRKVAFRPASTDTTERLAIKMDILAQYLDQIRHDSQVQIRPGGNLIGEPVVFITVGSGSAPRVHAGDTLHARAQLAYKSTAVDVAAIGDSVIAVANAMHQVIRDVHVTTQEITHVRRRAEMQAAAVGRALTHFEQRGARSHGTVSMLSHDTALRSTVQRITLRADSIRQLAAQRQRDTLWLATARQTSAELATLRARFVSPTTVLARHDSLLLRQLDHTHAQLDSLVLDVKRHPLKYLSL